MTGVRNSGFKDHFSGHASEYAQHRPAYPDTLVQWLADTSPARDQAWDAGTGNGQAAVALAQYFQAVLATDASVQQVDQAADHPGVVFKVEVAEDCSLPDRSTDLVTVGQALHWFEWEIPRLLPRSPICGKRPR